MKKYSPLLSVVVFGLLLLLPIGILALAQPAQQEVEEGVAAAEVDPRVAEQLSQLSERLVKLELQLEEMRQRQAPRSDAEPPAVAGVTEPTNPTVEPTTLAEAKPALHTAVPPTNEIAAPAIAEAPPQPSVPLTTTLATWLTRLIPEAQARAVAAADQPAQDNSATETEPPPKVERRTEAPPKTEPPQTTEPHVDEKAVAKPSAPSSRTRTKKAKPKDRAKSPDPREQAMPAEDAVVLQAFGDGADVAAVEHMIDVGISRPQPGNVVARWENLIATTQEPGWPVVLVRSEAKGDSWWVQQVVTRRGNVIAARVNFGNVETISAHGFEMVVLLLENSAQSVRFRTAREFKTIPAGVRRSQIFRYVRG